MTYDLYRSTTPGGEGATPYKTGLTSTSFVDAGLAAGTNYYYEVRADNIAGAGATSAEAHALTVTTLNTNFVNHVFSDFLHHAPNASQLNYYGNALQTGAMTDNQFVTAIMTSTEFRTTESSLVYQAMMGAVPSTPSLNAMVQELTNGYTLVQVMAIQFASSNFAAYANSLPGATSDQNGNFVKALFTELVGRSPSSAELTYWTSQVAMSSRYNIATSFLTSTSTTGFRFDFISALFAQTTLPASAFVHSSAVTDLLERPTAPSFSDVSSLVFSNMDLLTLEQAVAEGTEYYNKP